MHVISDLAPGRGPRRPPGTRLLASIDVEWSKNYRIRDGNRAFCYSILWLTLPAAGPVTLDTGLRFHCTSVYLNDDSERADLVEAAASDIAAATEAADLVAGHQLCSDLAVLAANAAPTAGAAPAVLAAARRAWHERRNTVDRPIIDTRFDAGHLLAGQSRRLVDVCGELGLRVTQPELARKSMTALHRDWLAHADVEARERVTVLNLRHSLSTALVALHAAGWATWTAPLDVNAILAAGLDRRIGWLDHPTFRCLLPQHHHAST